VSPRRSTHRKNLPYAAIAVIMAVGLAVSVYDQQEHEAVVEIGLTVSGLPPNVIFVGELPPRLTLRLRGPESELLELLEQSRNLRREVDLAGRRDGEEIRFDPASLEDLLGVREVRVIAVQPATVRVLLARRATRRVPVRPVFTGTPPEGYRVETSKVRVQPPMVVLSGPESAVMATTEVETAPIDVSDLDRPARFHQRILPPAEAHVTVDVKSVTIQVAITTELRRTELKDMAVRVLGCPGQAMCTVEPAQVVVTLHGPYPAISRLAEETADDLVRVVLPRNPGPGTQRLEIQLSKTAPGVYVHIEPPTALVSIEIPKKKQPSVKEPPAPAPRTEKAAPAPAKKRPSKSTPDAGKKRDAKPRDAKPRDAKP
jgi:hypothetical protein